MDSVKIIHMADLHLDSPLMGLPATKAAIRRDERRQSFADAIKKANEEKYDLALLAGDIFESENVSDMTLAFLKKCFASVPDMKIFIVPGNHDPRTPDSVYETFDFGENVYVFGTEAECVEIPEKNVRVYGQALSGRFENKHLFASVTAKDDEMINIAIVHGMLGADNEYNPISTADIENSKMDYVALGHVHTEHNILKAGKTFYAYSGIHDGRHFDEMEKCGYLSGEVGKGYVNLEFVTTAKRQTHVISVDISGCTTYDDIIGKLQLNCEDIYKITLTGAAETYFEDAVLSKRLSEKCFFCKISDKTRTTTAKNDGGALRDNFAALLSGKDDEISQLALKYGLRALSGEEVGAV